MKTLTFALSLLFISNMFISGQARLGSSYKQIMVEYSKYQPKIDTLNDGLKTVVVNKGDETYFYSFDKNNMCVSTNIVTSSKFVIDKYTQAYDKKYQRLGISNWKMQDPKYGVAYISLDYIQDLTIPLKDKSYYLITWK
jgi:hypothetical protein